MKCKCGADVELDIYNSEYGCDTGCEYVRADFSCECGESWEDGDFGCFDTEAEKAEWADWFERKYRETLNT